MKPSDNLQLAITAAQRAGEVVRKGFGNIKKIDNKGNGKGIVTDVDKASEETIISILRQSGYPILGEENGLVGKNSDTYWTVDPIDGTNNFSRNVELIAISIALIKEKKVILGVTYNPILDQLFTAAQGMGAYKNGEKIQVLENTIDKPIIFVDVGNGEKARKIYTQTNAMLSSFYNLRAFGTTALELCYVAQGSYEAFLSIGDQIWDYAAGLCIVEEAGGKVSDWKGNAWNNSNSFILATNGKIHQELVEKISVLQNESSI